MTRRVLVSFLLVAAGFASKGAATTPDSRAPADQAPVVLSAAPPVAGTADPAQGSVEPRSWDGAYARNSVTGDATRVNGVANPDTGVSAGLGFSALAGPGDAPGGGVGPFTGTPATVPGASGACPPDMVAVEGLYCTEVRHNCLKWLDDPTLPYARCGEYEPRATCVGERIRMSFCIDRYEYTRPGEKVPMNHASFVIAQDTCKALGKRVCTEDEWNFACEGEEMRPYPYGWKREPKCNQDRPREELYNPHNKRYQELADHRMPAGANPECVSPFGVYDMVGNLDEPVLRESQRHAYPYRNGLKGGWWMPARNRCRPATTKHDDHYHDIQVGVRCCADAPGASTQPHG